MIDVDSLEYVSRGYPMGGKAQRQGWLGYRHVTELQTKQT